MAKTINQEKNKQKRQRAKTDYSRSKLTDALPNDGPGIFCDDRAYESAKLAYGAIQRFLDDEDSQQLNVDWPTTKPLIESKLLEILILYWSDKDYDNRIRFSEMKLEVRRLQKALHRLRKVSDSTPKTVLRALNIEVARNDGPGLISRDYVANAREINDKLEKAAATLAKRKTKNEAPPAVKTVCASLFTMRETITGRPFLRQWGTSTTSERLVGERGNEDFIGLDALFVQVTLKAADPEVTLAQIRTSLRAFAKTKPSAKARKKSMTIPS